MSRRIASTYLDLPKTVRIRCSIGENVYFFNTASIRWRSTQRLAAARKPCVKGANNKIVDENLMVNDVLELRDGDFLRISEVLSGRSVVRGWRFCSTARISGLPKDLSNEVCWILHMRDGDSRNPKLQCIEDIPMSELVRKRRLILTNRNYPDLSTKVKNHRHTLKPEHDQSTLICRWKYICYVKSNKKQRSLAAVQFYSPANECSALIRLRKEECDEVLHQIDDRKLRVQRRGRSRELQDHPRSSGQESQINNDISRLGLDKLTLSQSEPRSSLSGDLSVDNAKRDDVYTFGDAFCGAGGASRGAAMAGLQVRWGFDLDIYAYEAYKANF